LAENFCGKLWRKTSEENFGGKLLQKTLAENFCGKLGRKLWRLTNLGGYTEFRSLVKIQDVEISAPR
jgi:hypothetical protein